MAFAPISPALPGAQASADYRWMQLILGVFDFPGRAPAGAAEVPVPELIVRSVLA